MASDTTAYVPQDASLLAKAGERISASAAIGVEARGETRPGRRTFSKQFIGWPYLRRTWGQINLRNWAFDQSPEMDRVIAKLAQAALREMFESEPPAATIELGGRDPLRIDVSLPLGPYEGAEPIFSVSLGAIVDELIHRGVFADGGDGGYADLDVEDFANVERFAVALRALVNHVEAHLTKCRAAKKPVENC